MFAKTPACRKLTRRFVRAFAIAAGYFLVSIAEAPAASLPLECNEFKYFLGGETVGFVSLRNTTGRVIPAGAKLTVTICDSNGCRKVVATAWRWEVYEEGKPATPFQPGEGIGAVFIIQDLPPPPPEANATCSASMWVPDAPRPSALGPGARIAPPKVDTAKPTPPPQPGDKVALRCKVYKLEGGRGVTAVVNHTGRAIPAGTTVVITVCDKGNCRTISTVTSEEIPPGGYMPSVDTVPGATCAATIIWPWSPDRPRQIGVEAPKTSRIKPPGPPQPGLLEDSPGFSRQTPSSVGTPKPSAPPPSGPSLGAPTLR